MNKNNELISTTGMLHVVDPSPLNWLYVLFNTMEEAVRADRKGRITPSLGESWRWVDNRTLEVKLRRDVLFHNNQLFSSKDVKRNFEHLQRWLAPHPPGTWLNFPEGTKLEVMDEKTVRYRFPKPDGLALGKMRGHHYANKLFWKTIGFGYAKLASAEGHW
ncbi:ABC transporter substrate-binding protein [Rossellomorea aquimaris]|nr:ABC transporter substrate-binding protein [Rossellomorea aquimaris]